MCLMVYIGSDKPLPLIDWNEDKPAFCISELTKYEKNVAAQFELPYVYNAGSHHGCGCGFLKQSKDEDELSQAQKNYIQLNTYLQKTRKTSEKFHIYVCWDGDQEAKPESCEKIELKRLVEIEFEFKEKVLYEIL